MRYRQFRQEMLLGFREIVISLRSVAVSDFVLDLQSWLRDGRLSSVMQIKEIKAASLAAVLTLAYQSFGVVYGDLSISPLYVFRSTFGGSLRDHVEEYEIMAVLSFIFWTLTLIPVVKYGFIVLSAHDNGEGTAVCFFQP